MIIEWFQKVGAVYRMDDITIDNAIFILDSYLYSQMNSGSSMLREDFQVIIFDAKFYYHSLFDPPLFIPDSSPMEIRILNCSNQFHR